MTYTKLGDLLVGSGTITKQQLDRALAEQKENGKRLGAILVEDGVITEKQVMEALMTQLGLEYVDLNAADIPADMAKLLPRNIARKYQVVPVRATRSELWLAMADPLNFMAIEEVSAATHRQVIPMIAAGAAVERAVQNLYSSQGTMKAIEDMRRDLAGSGQAAAVSVQDRWKLTAGESDEEAAPTIRLVNSIIERACTENASDIHLEPVGSHMRIRMRIDGALRDIITVPRELQTSVLSRIKIMAQMDITQRQLPQDGRIEMSVRQESLDLRVSTLPTIYGEKIVIRLLRRNEDISVDGIGLRGENRKRFLDLLDSSADGMILVVGPTGAGKTSTLYTMIDRKRSDQVNLVSLEDPVEYHIDGVNQVQINEHTGLTFAHVLRSVLRQDPDIIAVGEIRDGETAQIAMRAALTGHLVLSTVHTTDALSTIDRLLDIGVEPYLISSALRGVVSQRLVRRVCPHCRKPYAPAREELELLGLPPEGDYTFYRGEGCSECFQTGYRGRTGVFEILAVTPALRRAIHDRSLSRLEAALKDSTFQPLREDCAQLVAQGITTVEEVLHTIGRGEL